MDKEIIKLIEKFDLSESVNKFVKENIEKITQSKQFRFEGSDISSTCDISVPHVPHVISCYETVRYGGLERFCHGLAGHGINIIIKASSRGNASSPSYCSGYWFFDNCQ